MVSLETELDCSEGRPNWKLRRIGGLWSKDRAEDCPSLGEGYSLGYLCPCTTWKNGLVHHSLIQQTLSTNYMPGTERCGLIFEELSGCAGTDMSISYSRRGLSDLWEHWGAD